MQCIQGKREGRSSQTVGEEPPVPHCVQATWSRMEYPTIDTVRAVGTDQVSDTLTVN